MNRKQEIFNKSPMWLKELAAAYEAIRRNRSRRWGDYQQALDEYSFLRMKGMTREQIASYQVKKVNELFAYARENCEFYRARLPEQPLFTLEDLQKIPVLKKSDVRENDEKMISKAYDRKNLVFGQTSGSTGTPLRITISREAVRVKYAIEDNYTAYWGTPYGTRRARFSGVQVTNAKSEKPPFWVYNLVYNQLQMSAYHITNKTVPYYIDKLRKFKPVALNGYPHSLYFLASYLLEKGEKLEGVKAIYTDSENLLPEFRIAIEQAFQAQIHDRYGCGEVTGGAYGCSQNRYAETSVTCILEVLDANDQPVKPGETGRVIFTDLINYGHPYIRYDTGDLAVKYEGCSCEFGHLTHIDNIVGRLDDMVITPKGRWIGRLSHVTKPGIGIRESQIRQDVVDRIDISIVPAENFDVKSMDAVVAKAKEYLGDEMNVTWKLVDHIPPNPNSHKLKHVIRDPKLGTPKL